MSARKHNADSSKRSLVPSETEMFGEFQDWCLRTYGDSAKTKTVTRRKYDKILQALSVGEDTDAYADGSHINAKFKFWVKSKGFQVGKTDSQRDRNGKPDRPVLYVPIKATVSRLRVFLFFFSSSSSSLLPFILPYGCARNSLAHLPMQIYW